MMHCTEFEARLYDEDCREALARRNTRPADMQEHMEGCAHCCEFCEQAESETIEIVRALALQPPTRLRRELYAMMSPPSASRRPWFDWSLVAWAITGAAMGAALHQFMPGWSPMWQWAGACFVASHVLAVAIIWRLFGD